MPVRQTQNPGAMLYETPRRTVLVHFAAERILKAMEAQEPLTLSFAQFDALIDATRIVMTAVLADGAPAYSTDMVTVVYTLPGEIAPRRENLKTVVDAFSAMIDPAVTA